MEILWPTHSQPQDYVYKRVVLCNDIINTPKKGKAIPVTGREGP
jgi:hypothetical protein